MQYQIVCDFDLTINKKMLDYVYLPILGRDCINLYNILISEHEYTKNLYSNISLEEEHLLNMLELKNITFTQCRQKLEALGLLETYVNTNKGDFITFKLVPPLNWKQFCDVDKFVNLLKNKTTPLEFERTRYCFEGNNNLVGLLNVSSTFEQQFSEIEPQAFDFNALYDELFKMTNSLITIPENTKARINHLFTNHKISKQEIISLCYQSIYNDGVAMKIDDKILQLKISEKAEQSKLGEFNQIKKINRNINLFLDNINPKDMELIINDYHSLNSEQYLACVQKNPVDDIDVKIIQKLKRDYQLPDFVVNILLDYSIFINNGRLEPMYLQKIALTINRKNIKKVDLIIDHLKNAAKAHFQNKSDKWVNW